MMIWKSMRSERDAHRLQISKIALRVAYTGHGMDVGFVKIGGCCGLFWIQQVEKHITGKAHFMLPFAYVTAIHYDGIDRMQTRFRFAQRAGGKQQAVAITEFAIDDRDFHISLQPVMLQTIIAQHNIALRVGLQRRLSSGNPICSHPHGANFASSHQQWLVPDLRGRAGREYRLRIFAGAAITSADDERKPAPLDQLLRQGKRKRRFSGATDTDVADHNDRQQ